ncbi:hypothetical protein OIU84_020342 [Salix udensis]|uniref:Glucose-methanol-choline oxidoreductase N-terminal domain-containing protein n=1 Tax=Salix udensis TaxID=889485 RepID=A0AAD6PGA9_9ROSI|nr:hypothetical protein OIU84_020342 [Salix udensis]
MKKPVCLFLIHIVFLVLFCSLFSHARPIPQTGPDYLKFVLNATEFPPEDYYDYIVVGGGTTGCPLAATLSQSYRVLLLERGGVTFGKHNLMSQDGFLSTLNDVDTFDSPAQAFMSEDGVPNARGRVLGGSSAINAGFYSRADPAFFQQSGVEWDLDIVNQAYEWVEEAIVFRPELRNWQSAVRDGLLEAGVEPYTGFSLEHVVGTKIGGSTFDGSGRRHSAADLLNHANGANIQVAVYASVERILLASTSQYFKVSALLLISGIGPRSYLSSLGIPVSYHLPYVGQYLYDNPRNGISIVPPMPLENSLIQVVGITEAGTYLEAASTVIPFVSPARAVFIRTPSTSPLYLSVATLMEKIVGPLSTGSLRLASTDVRVNPIVRFNYFSNPVDVERCVNGTRKIGDVLRSRSMEDFMFREWFGARNFRYVGPALPVDLSDFTQMADFCRRTVSTIWHYHGGCVMGKVVDRDYHLIGVGAIRVVDGSTLTVSPGTNPQATLMMLGRYLGLKIIRERKKGH